MALTEVPIELSSTPGIVDNSTGTAITIDASGNTGIGETNPIVPLHVLDETGATSLLGNVAATFRTGSASNPVNIQFSDETSAANVGMAAGDLFFATGSTGRMRITSNGSVGINTDSPAAGGGGLHVNGGTSGTPATSGTTQNGALRLSSDATSGILDFGMNGANPWIQATDSGGLNNNYNILLNPNGGNVGIGTDSPAFAEGSGLDIERDSASATLRLQRLNTGASGLEIQARSSEVRFQEVVGSVPMTFYTGGSEAIRIANTGQLLVGDGQTPASGEVKQTLVRGGSSYLEFQNTSTNTGSTIGTSGENLIVYTNSGALGSETYTERLRIDSSGDIRLTGTAPNAEDSISTVNFYNSSSSLNLASITGKRTAGGTNYGSLIFNTTSAGSIAERMRIDSSGNLLVGTTSISGVTSGVNVYGSTATHGIEIKNTSAVTNNSQAGCFLAYGSSVANLGCYKHSGITNPAGYVLLSDSSANGYFLYQNGGTWRTSGGSTNIGTTGGTVVGTQTSDERLKNIEPTFEYGIDHVMQLNPIAYTRNDEEAPVRKLGFGAQSTQTVVPEAVYDTGECINGYDVDTNDPMIQTPKSDDTKLAMEYVQLIPVLTKAIQEQQDLIESLTARIATLEGAN